MTERKTARDEGENPERERGDRAEGRGGGRPERGAQPNAAVEWLKSIVIATVVFLVLRTFLLQTFVITSGSMERTLMVGDFLLVNRAAIGSRVPFTDIRIPGYSEAHRLDVIVFDPPHEEDMKLVKRLIGMPGDTIAMVDGVVMLNGVALAEPYVRRAARPDDTDSSMRWQLRYLHPSVETDRYRPTRDNWGPLVIPADRYFMLGDNRNSSLDSRYWGLLEGWRLEGRVSRIYFSYNRGSFRPFPWLREVRWARIGDGIA